MSVSTQISPDGHGPMNSTSNLSCPSFTAVDLNSYQSFDVQPTTLNKLVKEKNLESLQRDHGGVDGIAAALQTSKDYGIQGDDTISVQRRREEFGSNTYPQPLSKPFSHFVLEGFKDPIVLLFLALPTLALGFGIKENGFQGAWKDGGNILVAVFIVILVSSISNFRHHIRLRKSPINIEVQVVRSGQLQKISVRQIVVGDVICLRIGDQVPADGLFLDGHSLHMDELSMTGKSDRVEINSNQHPFLFFGTTVVNGFAKMLVTSVGINTTWGQMMSSIGKDTNKKMPLKTRLHKLTPSIRKLSRAGAFLVVVVLLIAYFTGNTRRRKNGKIKEFNERMSCLDYIVSVIIGLVAAAVAGAVVVPNALPFAVTLTLANVMKKMMGHQVLLRKPTACETMGSSTVICTGTGSLALNQMKVTKFWLGHQYVTEEAYSSIGSLVLGLIQEGVALNTTSYVSRSASNSGHEFSGSPTDKAILSWAIHDLDMDMDMTRNCTILYSKAFNPESTGVLMRREEDTTTHVHWKGAAEMVLGMCSRYYNASGNVKHLDKSSKLVFGRIIKGMASSGLRCIAFAHREIVEEELQDKERTKNVKEDDLTLLGLVGIKDPCRQGVKKAVEDCQKGGIKIKLITADNVFNAKAIAMECGILKPDQEDTIGFEAVIEGEEFRNYTAEKRQEKMDKISVMASCSSFDKLLMVQCLKQKGNVVAVTGDGTNDAPALKEADVGLCIGIKSSEVAKESSDIIIFDDTFAAVATVLKYGRWMRNCRYKFIAVQLTVNFVAIAINLLAIIKGDELPLTVGHLCLGNMIIYIIGTLGLSTRKPTMEEEMPHIEGIETPLGDIIWSNVAKASYQIAMVLMLQLGGNSFLSADSKAMDIFIFNAFLLYQVFNEFHPTVNSITIPQLFDST